MKLLNFVRTGDTHRQFGVLVDGRVLAFHDLVSARGEQFSPMLESTAAYCRSLPESFHAARDLVDSIAGPAVEAPCLADIKILPPIEPPALFDFGLTPRHLLNSAETMFKHEFGRVTRRLVTALVKRKLKKMANSEVIPYYKGNHHAIIGDGDTTGWPPYSSYIDFEPELAVVYGSPQDPVAGYTIFNDMSARDIQWPEMIGTGPARSKDFDRSNGLGPFLVTPDELTTPRNIKVNVKVGNRFEWSGTTGEYTHEPRAVIDYLSTFLTLQPGTVIGMGTIPGCTGLDNDEWVLPGEQVTMEFDGLGRLTQHIPPPPADHQPSRWEDRSF